MTVEPDGTIDLDDGRQSPLSGWTTRLLAGSREGTVVLREVPFLTQVGLRVPQTAVGTRRAVVSALGLDLPDRSGATTVHAGRTALWLGPDEWLVVEEPGRTSALVQALVGATAGSHASVVDLSANRTVLELSGPQARDVLEGGCHLDLHPRAFGPGRCVPTQVARVPVYLHQLDDSTYRLFVRPSFAAYLAGWLLDAMVEHTDATR